MTPSGTEPAIFRIVTKWLTNCATKVARGRVTAVCGGSSIPQAYAPGYINLMVVAEVLKPVVSVQQTACSIGRQ